MWFKRIIAGKLSGLLPILGNKLKNCKIFKQASIDRIIQQADERTLSIVDRRNQNGNFVEGINGIISNESMNGMIWKESIALYI
uniref:Uncharacterized protein n=1 Tax=Onchocerca volvulus TaxID=6282 RepID=A0A8R1XLG5_ONCVO